METMPYELSFLSRLSMSRSSCAALLQSSLSLMRCSAAFCCGASISANTEVQWMLGHHAQEGPPTLSWVFWKMLRKVRTRGGRIACFTKYDRNVSWKCLTLFLRSCEKYCQACSSRTLLPPPGNSSVMAVIILRSMLQPSTSYQSDPQTQTMTLVQWRRFERSSVAFWPLDGFPGYLANAWSSGTLSLLRDEMTHDLWEKKNVKVRACVS